LSQKDPKKPGSRDISELKARLGLKKAGPAAAPGKQNGQSVVPPPGLNLPPPPGARAPGPVIPSASDDPFGAMNAMAAHGASQRAPEIVIVNDGRPVESVSTGQRAATIGKWAAIAIAPLLLGVVIGQIGKGASVANSGIDSANGLYKLVDADRKKLGEIKSAFENSGDLKDRKVSDEVTKAIDTAEDELASNKILALSLKQDFLGKDLRNDVSMFYGLVQEISDLIGDHTKTAEIEAAAIKTGADQFAKFGVKADETLAQAGMAPYKVAVLLTNPSEEGTNDPQAPRLVELGAPLCGADMATAKVEESGKCPEGTAPVGFLYRFGDTISWQKGKIHLPNSLNGGEKFPNGELILFQPTGVLDALVKTSGATLAEAAYFKRLVKIYDKVKAAYELGDKLKGDLKKKADSPKGFTFFL
jgi:hypothetical protein